MSDLCFSPSWTSRYLTILSRNLAKMSSFQGAARTDFEHHEHHEHHSLYRSARQVDHLCILRQAVQRQTFTKGQTVTVVVPWIFWTCYNLFKLKPCSMSKSQAQLEGASTSRGPQCGLLRSLGRGKGQKLETLDMGRRKWSKWHLLVESNLHPSTSKTCGSCGGQQPGWLRLQAWMLTRFQPHKRDYSLKLGNLSLPARQKRSIYVLALRSNTKKCGPLLLAAQPGSVSPSQGHWWLCFHIGCTMLMDS